MDRLALQGTSSPRTRDRRAPARPGTPLFALLLLLPLAFPASATDLATTKHNLSVTGPGATRALTESRTCVFCHTPHDATPQTPLWNRELEPQAYLTYTSPTMKAGVSQPWGPTKLCLSCHDGTIALGAVLRPAGGIAMIGGGTLPPGSLSDFGTDLTGHHPVSFNYSASLPNAELVTPLPTGLTFGGVDELHCTTCHDPHDDTNGRFLVKDNRSSALCVTCHRPVGWAGSAHATSSAPVTGLLPRPPKSWPTYGTLGEWGCETCHTPHFAPTAEQLLNFTATGPDPFSCTSAGCHTSGPGPGHSVDDAGRPRTDVDRQTKKPSAHRLGAGAAAGVRATTFDVGCSDCHNAHQARSGDAAPPAVTGPISGVRGVDRNGVPARASSNQYEICFRCHGDRSEDVPFVPRVVQTTNQRKRFGAGAVSAHPVVEPGRNPNVPSLPSRNAPSTTASSMIWCTDCHADDEGARRGPHGSSFPPILRERYETADGTPESADSYALCYRCHERTSILADESFRKTAGRGGHSGHLASGISCAACHDPHGVPDDSGATGSHSHLVNFDTRIVSAAPGSALPIYSESGAFSGSCTLTCHGVVHSGSSYP